MTLCLSRAKVYPDVKRQLRIRIRKLGGIFALSETCNTSFESDRSYWILRLDNCKDVWRDQLVRFKELFVELKCMGQCKFFKYHLGCFYYNGIQIVGNHWWMWWVWTVLAIFLLSLLGFCFPGPSFFCCSSGVCFEANVVKWWVVEFAPTAWQGCRQGYICFNALKN